MLERAAAEMEFISAWTSELKEVKKGVFIEQVRIWEK